LITGNRSARYSLIANLVNLWNAFGTGLRQKRMVASMAREFARFRTKPTCNAPRHLFASDQRRQIVRCDRQRT
jgi:hypothetical protein